MKSKKTIIPLKMRSEMEVDPEYKTCALYGQAGHTCEGRITWEHAMTYGGKSLQEKWAIIPLCASGHSVDQYQDNHELNKELNKWCALNRATDDELLAISKAENYIRTRNYLNTIYGAYKRIYPPKTAFQKASEFADQVEKVIQDRMFAPPVDIKDIENVERLVLGVDFADNSHYIKSEIAKKVMAIKNKFIVGNDVEGYETFISKSEVLKLLK